MTEIKYANAADLLPIKMILDKQMSPKKVANIFASQGIPLRIIGQSNSYLPFSHYCAVYEHAARSLGDANLGVYCGAKWGAELIGPLGDYAAAAPDLNQCLHRLIAAIHMYESGSYGSLTRQGELVKFSYFLSSEHPVGRKHVANANVGFLLNIMRFYTGTNWLPIRIETDHPKVSYSTFLEAFYKVPVESGKSSISFIFSAKDLNAPNPCQGSALADYTLSDFSMLMDETPPCTMVDSVTQVVRIRLLAGLVDIEGAARQLKLGVRSMQRRLSIAGESYRNILARERINRAVALLSQNNHSITKIAMMQGYEYVGDFTRAFTKAKGHSPSEFRQSNNKYSGAIVKEYL